MFFSLSKSQDPRFPQHNIIGSWYFSHDLGWNCSDNSWSKGYFHTKIEHGNFLKIVFDGQYISLLHENGRSFPLWWDSNEKVLTNLCGTGERIWADRTVKLTQDNLIAEQIVLSNFSLNSTLTLDQACNLLVENFVTKARSLANDYAAIDKRLFVSGGIDTVTLYALVKNQQIDVDIIDFEHFDYDWFTNHNIAAIRRNHWAYGQIHHWQEDCILMTGGCGDEYMFRGPHTIAIWAAWHDLDVVDLCQKSQGYHVEYFLLDKNVKIFKECYDQRQQIKEQFRTKQDLNLHLIDVNANDHQYWHLGKTLTWTPFKDLTILETVLKLDYDTLVEQILDANINRKIIQRLYPYAFELLSKDKNHMSRQNLHLL